jgi:hypothetical protein
MERVHCEVSRSTPSESSARWLSWQGDRMKVQARHTRQKRLHILNDDEREALDGRPRLTPEERLEYFTLSPASAFHSKPCSGLPLFGKVYA